MSKMLVFIYDDMADFEITLATTTVSWLGMEIVTIAYTDKVITAKAGLKYLPHMTVKHALELDDISGLIIPGGWNNEQRPELTELIQRLYNDNKLVSAICAGPQYLARSGILDHRTYTTTLTSDHLKKEGITDFFPRENFVDQNVVRDSNVITALGNCFVDFAMEIIDYFKAFEDEEMKNNYANLYKGIK